MGRTEKDIEGLEIMAERLRMIRAYRNLRQNDVFEQTGISQSALSLYEKGRRDPHAQTLKALAIFYGVTTDWLLGMAPLEEALTD